MHFTEVGTAQFIYFMENYQIIMKKKSHYYIYSPRHYS